MSEYQSYAGLTAYRGSDKLQGGFPITTLFSSRVPLDNSILSGYEIIVVKQDDEEYDDFLDRTASVAKFLVTK